MATNPSPAVTAYLAAIGARGGSRKSAAKTAACRANARRPRGTSKHRGQQPGAFGGKSKAARAAAK